MNVAFFFLVAESQSHKVSESQSRSVSPEGAKHI